MRFFSCLIFILIFTHSVHSARATAQQADNPKQGTLVICGGGSLPDSIISAFVKSVGGTEGRLIVIPTASSQVDEKSQSRSIEYWTKAGIGEVSVLHTRDREQADTKQFVEPLTKATGVWLGGGQQSRLAAVYQGTATEQALIDLFKRGGTVGGTSAGAAIQSKVMIQSGNPVPTLSTGFDLIPGVIVDQHFLRRNRFNRLLNATRKYPKLQGVGIAESTAFFFQDGKGKVIGKSFVTVITPGQSADKLSISTFGSGQSVKIGE